MNDIKKLINFLIDKLKPNKQVNKINARYTSYSRSNSKCKNCSHFMYANKCELVEGDISPVGWCNKFK